MALQLPYTTTSLDWIAIAEKTELSRDDISVPLAELLPF